MQTIAGRVFAFAGAIAGVAAGAHGIAAPAPATIAVAASADPAAPPCREDLEGRVVAHSANGSVHRATIVVAHKGEVCTLAGPPDVVLGEAGDAMPTGYLSVPQPIRVGNGMTAAFEIRYVSGAETSASCALAFRFDGVALQMPPLHLHRCERPSEIDLSSVAQGDAPPSEAIETDRSAFENVMPCRASDFSIRPVDANATPSLEVDRFALQNRGANACRTPGSIDLRFLDRGGVALDERVAAKTQMPLDLVIPHGREVSFAVRFPTTGDACPPATTLSIAFATPGGGSAQVPLKAAPCRSATQPIEVSDLVFGVPIEAR